MSQPSTSMQLVWMRVLVLSCIVLCIAFAVRASGEDKKSASQFAIVDFKKLANDYKAKDTIEAKVKDMQAKYDARLRRRYDYPLLTEDEQQTLDTIYEKPNPTAQEQARQKEIEDKAKQQAADWAALQNKPNPNDDDKAKLADMEKKRGEAQTRYAALKDNLGLEFAKFQSTQSDELMSKVQASIAKVAEQKGIGIVFNSEVAPYAGSDITQPVLNDLNKGK